MTLARQGQIPRTFSFPERTILPIYIGYDAREAQAWHVCAQSIIEQASGPVQIIPLNDKLTSHGGGTNAFHRCRFLVPDLQHWQGWAIFCDSDMLWRADPYRLLDHGDNYCAVQVVQHDYATRFPRKYVGSAMESDNLDYPKKNWSSLMLWNCGHRANRVLDPEFVAGATPQQLHRFEWLKESFVGDLPADWNHLVREGVANPDAKLMHWTLGVPTLDGGHYAQDEGADEWRTVLERANRCG